MRLRSLSVEIKLVAALPRMVAGIGGVDSAASQVRSDSAENVGILRGRNDRLAFRAKI